MRRIGFAVVAAALAAGCIEEGKQEVEEDFSDLAGLDDKSDYFSWRLRLLGTVGDGWKNTWYTSSPRFRGWTFYADPGDEVTVKLWSSQGDPVTWILDSDFNVLAKNDDASDDAYDSYIRFRVPAPGSRDRRYFIVFRDYDLRPGRFYLDYKWKKGTPPSDWTAQARAWFSEQIVVARWDIAGSDYVVEPDAFPYSDRARQFEERTQSFDQPWSFDLAGRHGYALVSAWDDRFFADIYDESMSWVAHAYGFLVDDRVTDLYWDADDNDPTTCACDDSHSSAVCTWLDGTSFFSGSILCD